MKINDISSDLRSAWIDWREYLANPNYVRIDQAIGWPKFEKVWTGDAVTIADIRALAEKRQFSFQIAEDGALVQLWYECDVDGELEDATIGYYALPLEESGSDVADMEAEENREAEFVESGGTAEVPQGANEGQSEVGEDFLLSLEEVAERLRATYPYEGIAYDERYSARAIRIDYRKKDPINPIHHACHMHISGYPDTRLCLSRVPTPRQFLELMFALFYPESFKGHRLNDANEFRDINHVHGIYAKGFPVELGALTKSLTHLFVPGV